MSVNHLWCVLGSVNMISGLGPVTFPPDFQWKLCTVISSGYVKLQTTHGELNLELHCDMVSSLFCVGVATVAHTLLHILDPPYTYMYLVSIKVPKTCENFLKLCSSGYYENTSMWCIPVELLCFSQSLSFDTGQNLCLLQRLLFLSTYISNVCMSDILLLKVDVEESLPQKADWTFSFFQFFTGQSRISW